MGLGYMAAFGALWLVGIRAQAWRRRLPPGRGLRAAERADPACSIFDAGAYAALRLAGLRASPPWSSPAGSASARPARPGAAARRRTSREPLARRPAAGGRCLAPRPRCSRLVRLKRDPHVQPDALVGQAAARAHRHASRWRPALVRSRLREAAGPGPVLRQHLRLLVRPLRDRAPRAGRPRRTGRAGASASPTGTRPENTKAFLDGWATPIAEKLSSRPGGPQRHRARASPACRRPDRRGRTA